LNHAVPAFPFARLDNGRRSRLGKKQKNSFLWERALHHRLAFAGSHRPEMPPSLIQRISAETVNRMLDALSSKQGHFASNCNPHQLTRQLALDREQENIEKPDSTEQGRAYKRTHDR
jgi:hypothetical protein